MSKPFENVSTPGGWPEGPLLAAILQEVIDRWHRHEAACGDWEAAEQLLTPRHAGWAGLVERIQLINTFQWHEEDRSRDPGADDATLAATKRSIDASNARRVAAVEAFDTLIRDSLASSGMMDETAPLHSESPGSIVDRLTVLALKAHHAREALASHDGGAADGDAIQAARSQLAMIEEQMSDLLSCLARLQTDIRGGRLRIKLYRQVKIYRAPAEGG